MMNVVLSFDVEVWCDGWEDIDAKFPACFERYVYGRSPRGDYALPKTLEIMRRHGIRGVFFVEPLFAARFGEEPLRTIVRMIADEGHDVQLHLHPEWTDELPFALIPDHHAKRQFLHMYTRQEQQVLIGHGKAALERILGRPVTAFRAGSFAANRDTYHALEACGIAIDSSLNDYYPDSGGDVERPARFATEGRIGQVRIYPVTMFADGRGRLRPVQVNGCSLSEMTQALDSAERGGCRYFVIVSHNFEMLKPGRSEPDAIVVRRFEGLCRFLGEQRHRFSTGPYPALGGPEADERRPTTGLWSTVQRHAEQAYRRIF